MCFDSFLHMFTILPLRVIRAGHILIQRRFHKATQPPSRYNPQFTPLISSSLQPSERTDLLKGALIILTYLCMSMFDASRVYHSIRGQSSIKLYVLFNVLDVRFSYSFLILDRGSTLLFDWTRYL